MGHHRVFIAVLLLVLPVYLGQEEKGSALLGPCVGAVLGLIAGLVIWARNSGPK